MFGLWHESVESFAFTVYKQRATFENEINQSVVIVSRESTIVSSLNISHKRLFIKKIIISKYPIDYRRILIFFSF